MEFDIPPNLLKNVCNKKFLYGMPFFRNNVDASCPPNNETNLHTKEENRAIELTKVTLWNSSERTTLKELILKHVIETCKQHHHKTISALYRSVFLHENVDQILTQKMKILKRIEELNNAKYDDIPNIIAEIELYQKRPYILNWTQILKEKKGIAHSSEECQGLWNTILNPTWSQSEWCSSELRLLEETVTKYANQDWDNIAAELPNRSPLQCFQKYQCNINRRARKKLWSVLDNNNLRRFVKMFSIGEFVSWSDVTSQYTDRTRMQIYNHYINISRVRKLDKPSKSVQLDICKLSKDYSKLKVRLNPFRKKWSTEEDQTLLKYVKEHGHDWCRICVYFPGRNRENCRDRHRVLRRWMEKHPMKPLLVESRMRIMTTSIRRD